MNSRSPVILDAKARAKPAIDALMLGVMRQAKPVAPTTPAERRLKRTDSQRLTRSKSAPISKSNGEHTYHPTSNSKDLHSSECQKRKEDVSQMRTVSTQRNMSRKNLDDAPNARMMVTPAMVSP